MLFYLLKSAACLTVFLVFYKVLLEKENMHVFKRYYLLASILVSFAIPRIILTEYVDVGTLIETDAIGNHEIPTGNETGLDATSGLVYTYLIIGIYGLGLLLFGLKFFKNLMEIFHRIRSNPKLKNSGSIKVLLQEHIVPHTFFNYIFLNKNRFEKQQIPREVLDHEETHAKQKHSLDILFVEVVHVFLWFNPLLYLFKKAIKLNHEFLADRTVLQNNIDPKTYQQTLLEYSLNENQPLLANAFTNSSYSSIKKRFTVMKRKTSKKSVLLRSTLLIPLLALLLFGFSTRQTMPRDNTPQQTGFVGSELESPLPDLVYVARTPFEALDKTTSDGKLEAFNVPEQKLPPQQEGATKKQVREYNTLAKKYNAMSHDNYHVIGREVARIKDIYNLMSAMQKENAEPFPNIPGPPPPPPTPALATSPATSSIPARAESPAIAPKITKGEKSNIPPPPAHPPMVRKGEKSNIPPPPPPKTTQTIAVTRIEKPIQIEVGRVVDKIEVHENVTEPVIIHVVEIEDKIQTPPSPKSPLAHVIAMAKKGATFYYEGKAISSDKAIQILKENDQINVDSRGSTGKNPVVKLSTKGITIEN